MAPHTALLILAASTVFLLSGCVSTNTQEEKVEDEEGVAENVFIVPDDDSKGHLFEPRYLTVPAGALVIWRNHNEVAHTITSDDDLWDPVKIFNENPLFREFFDEPGRFTYHCEIHPWMKGTITVTPS